ncbi:hypothetical protein VTJ04DRAFT_2350 [Mycothermus thermophilus]|uniref:uncharacterized protein n=1 Tax=Humicola insolens TaxID=85995 RepID=UPI00374433DA
MKTRARADRYRDATGQSFHHTAPRGACACATPQNHNRHHVIHTHTHTHTHTQAYTTGWMGISGAPWRFTHIPQHSRQLEGNIGRLRGMFFFASPLCIVTFCFFGYQREERASKVVFAFDTPPPTFFTYFFLSRFAFSSAQYPLAP